MQTIYLFSWNQMSANAYTYGSSINYPNVAEVDFENDLQPSGQAIYTWENLSIETSEVMGIRPTVTIPILEPGCEYHVEADMLVTPIESVGIRIDFFDRRQQVIEQVFKTDLAFDFVYPKQAKTYQIQLIKFNNTALRFNSILLQSKKIQSYYTIKVNRLEKYYAIRKKQLGKCEKTIKIILKSDVKPLNTVYIDEYVDATYNFLLPQTLLTDEIALIQYMEKVKAFYLHTWQAVTGIEVVGVGYGTNRAVQICRDVLQHLE